MADMLNHTQFDAERYKETHAGGFERNSPEASQRMLHNIELIHKRWEQEGRKALRPSVEMCEAFEHVDLSFPCHDYAQPYRTLRVDFPEAIAKRIGCEYAYVYHGHVKPLREDCTEEQEILMFAASLPKRKEWMMFAEGLGTTPDREVEDRLFGYREVEDAVLTLCRPVVRMALNAVVAATHYATRVVKPVCPYPKWPGTKRREWERAAPHYVDFVDQQIRWVDRQTDTIPGGEGTEGRQGTGVSMTPHWRRGHWRMQACGVKLSERKKIFIRPVLINGAFHTHKGMDNTEYVAKGRG